MIRRTFILALPLALAACGNEADVSSDAGAIGDAAPAIAADALVERFDDTLIVVDSNGVGPKGKEPFRFGSPRGEVDAALAKAYGSEPKLADCDDPGSGDMRSSDFGPLQVVYEDDRMVGWLLRPGRGVTTLDGVRPGTTTYSGLRSERPVRRINSDYLGGFEYTAADYGTIGGSANGDRITLLTAGLSCPSD